MPLHRAGTAMPLAVFLIGLSGCGGPSTADTTSTSSHWADSLHATEVRSIRHTPEPCGDCLTLALRALMGDTAGPGYVVHTAFVVQDSSGRYWLGQYRDMVKVFDSAGRYLTTVGRPGTGPGEYQMPAPIHVAADSSVKVVDVGSRWVTAIAPDFHAEPLTRLPGSPWNLRALPGFNQYVANMPVASLGGAVQALHLILIDSIVRSFGPTLEPGANPFSLYRHLAVDPAGRIYSTSPTALGVEVWSAEGDRITGFGDFPLGSSANGAEPGVLNAPAPSINAIHVDARERLWVLVAVPRDDWRGRMRIVTQPDGQRAYTPLDDDAAGSIFSTRILVADLATSTLVADAARPEAFASFLEDGSLVELRQLPNGTPQVAVWDARLEGGTGR